MNTGASSRGRYALSVLGLATTVTFAFGLVSACVGEDAVAPPAGDGGADTGASQDRCVEYCSTVNKNCTGENRQYRDDAECMRVCVLLEPGAEGDRTQNTVSCRLANAKLGQTKAICANAGAWGGDVCGKRCETFCAVNAASCGTLGAAAPFADKADCLEKACPVLRFDPVVGDSPDQAFEGDDTLNCRSFHLVLALENALATHCPHTKLVSPVCRVRDAGAD
jgi:hypothetical protein